jgi:hypothetical protein
MRLALEGDPVCKVDVPFPGEQIPLRTRALNIA